MLQSCWNFAAAVFRVAHAPERCVALDCLRGVAILLVLLRHPVVTSEEAGFFRPLATMLCRFGWTGVDLFFGIGRLPR